MPLCKVYLDPPQDFEPGAEFEIDSFGTKKGAVLRESDKVSPYPEFEPHDDTATLAAARTTDRKPVRFLEANNPRFEKGIPTEGGTSAKGRPDSSVKIVDGEHKTLLSIGRMNEALDDDNHPGHILEHRMLLADPNLTETQRASLLDHIGDHGKKHRKRLKAAKETQEAQNQKGYKKGFGMMSRAKTPLKDDVIPEDDPQSRERKRTGGVISMESKLRRFDHALKTSGRRA